MTSDFLGPRGFQKITVRHQLEARWPPCPTVARREPSRSRPLQPHLIATDLLISYFGGPLRGGSSRPSSPHQSRAHASLENTAVCFTFLLASAQPAGWNQNLADSGIPLRILTCKRRTLVL